MHSVMAATRGICPSIRHLAPETPQPGVYFKSGSFATGTEETLQTWRKLQPPRRASTVTHTAPNTAPRKPRVPGLTDGARGPDRAGWTICPTGTNLGPTTSPFADMTRRTCLGFQFGPLRHLFLMKGEKGHLGGSSDFWPEQAQTIHTRMPITTTHSSALWLTGDTPTPQGAQSKGAKETGLRTHSAPGDPQVTETGCGRDGKHELRPSRSHRGRTARWTDPRTTSAPRSHHHQHHINDDLIP